MGGAIEKMDTFGMGRLDDQWDTRFFLPKVFLFKSEIWSWRAGYNPRHLDNLIFWHECEIQTAVPNTEGAEVGGGD